MYRASSCIRLFFIAILGYLFFIKRQSVSHAKIFSGNQSHGVNTELTDRFLRLKESTFQDASRRFVEGQPHSVYILSYQRCGSSFFGNIFGQHPDAFYAYEPLDSLYVSLYGTKEGWNVPADITSFANGSERVIPDVERMAISNYLDKMVHCQLDELHPEAFTHTFWRQFPKEHSSLDEFIKCQRSISPTLYQCLGNIRQKCGGRLTYENETRINSCLDQMAKMHSVISGAESNSYEAKWNGLDQEFQGYGKCIVKAKINNQHCEHIFRNICRNATFRAIKTVRGTMEAVEYLLQNNANMRVIHLIRGPRATVSSRKNFEQSGMGIYSLVKKNTNFNPEHHYPSNFDDTQLKAKLKALSLVNAKPLPIFTDYEFNVVREARLYCNTVVRDVLVRKNLQRKYPGAIIEVLFEEFVQFPMQFTEKLYHFIGIEEHPIIKSWIVQNTNVTSKMTNASYIANKWEDTLTFSEAKHIDAHCKTFYQEVPYKWPRKT